MTDISPICSRTLSRGLQLLNIQEEGVFDFSCLKKLDHLNVLSIAFGNPTIPGTRVGQIDFVKNLVNLSNLHVTHLRGAADYIIHDASPLLKAFKGGAFRSTWGDRDAPVIELDGVQARNAMERVGNLEVKRQLGQAGVDFQGGRWK